MFNPQMLMMYQQFRNNPMQMISKRFNIPEGVNVNDPSEIVKHLVNSGQVSQQQIDYYKNAFNQK